MGSSRTLSDPSSSTLRMCVSTIICTAIFPLSGCGPRQMTDSDRAEIQREAEREIAEKTKPEMSEEQRQSLETRILRNAKQMQK